MWGLVPVPRPNSDGYGYARVIVQGVHHEIKSLLDVQRSM